MLKTEEYVHFVIQKSVPLTLVRILQIKASARTALGYTKLTLTILARRVVVVMDNYAIFQCYLSVNQLQLNSH